MWRSQVQELERVQADTPGKGVRVASAGSGQSLDQSERTNTTEPAGIAPVRLLQRLDVGDLRA